MLEIVIIAFVLYHIILWVRKTRAWTLLKGIALLILCYLMAYFLNMSVILWLFNRTNNWLLIAESILIPVRSYSARLISFSRIISAPVFTLVSEETGKISVAVRGKLLRNVDGELLKKKLGELQGKNNEGKPKKRFRLLKQSCHCAQ